MFPWVTPAKTSVARRLIVACSSTEATASGDPATTGRLRDQVPQTEARRINGHQLGRSDGYGILVDRERMRGVGASKVAADLARVLRHQLPIVQVTSQVLGVGADQCDVGGRVNVGKGLV